jgi:multidrug efflux pump subunit AcrA (membrane-fusion protein)
MFQAWVTKVDVAATGTMATVRLTGPGHAGSTHYVLEIVTEPVEELSVPNEAIIESGGKQVVYVQGSAGTYEPREIGVGVRGELFTEVTKGLSPGEQVVTFGSFFIDAEHKLKGS